SGDTADDKATLFLDERAAAEVLALIARHFDFEWKRSHGGYELTQGLAAITREAGLRERGRSAQGAAIEARMGPVGQVASMTRPQQEEQRNDLDQRLSDRSLASEEKAKLIEQQAAIQDAQRPGAAAAATLFRSLSPAQLALLRGGGEIRLSTTDGSLPAPLADAVRQAADQQLQRDAQRMAERLGGNAGGAGPPPAPPEAIPPRGVATA